MILPSAIEKRFDFNHSLIVEDSEQNRDAVLKADATQTGAEMLMTLSAMRCDSEFPAEFLEPPDIFGGRAARRLEGDVFTKFFQVCASFRGCLNAKPAWAHGSVFSVQPSECFFKGEGT